LKQTKELEQVSRLSLSSEAKADLQVYRERLAKVDGMSKLIEVMI
jgi:hypothetical protein